MHAISNKKVDVVGFFGTCLHMERNIVMCALFRSNLEKAVLWGAGCLRGVFACLQLLR